MSWCVITTTAVEENVRGLLTRWLQEPAPGIYVGFISSTVRDGLWDALCSQVSEEDSQLVLIYPNGSEQGHTVRTYGKHCRQVIDLDGFYVFSHY